MKVYDTRIGTLAIFFKFQEKKLHLYFALFVTIIKIIFT